jgi:hypothetical protein
MRHRRAGRPDVFPACFLWFIAGVITSTSQTQGAPSTPVHKAIREGLPRYDPNIREAHLSALNKATAPAESPTDGQPDRGVISLPRIVVRPAGDQSQRPAAPLPRVAVKPSVNKVQLEPFLTGPARDAQLVKKHFTSFDRNFLNRFTLPLFGRSKESRALEHEAIQSAAVQLNTIADLIQREGAEGRDPAEQKKLKELYLDLYIARPK